MQWRSVGPANQPEKQWFSSKNIQIIKNLFSKMIFSFGLLRHLFWFTRQLSRISWTCDTGNEQCKFRQNIKWFGLKKFSIRKMRLKCRLRSSYLCVKEIKLLRKGFIDKKLKVWGGSNVKKRIYYWGGRPMNLALLDKNLLCPRNA